MKRIFLVIAILFILACSKDDLVGPSKLKNGQEVEVFVGHQYAAINEPLLLIPSNKPAEMSLYNFNDREPGYNYRVKAKVVKPAEPLQDAPSYWLEFVKVLSKEKSTTNEPFEIALIQSYLPGGPIIMLRKKDATYYYNDKLTLTYANMEVKKQLDEIAEFNDALTKSWEESKTIPAMKWQAIKATVTHDPQNFGKSYLVSRIEFTD
jgi:hypothetical protein